MFGSHSDSKRSERPAMLPFGDPVTPEAVAYLALYKR